MTPMKPRVKVMAGLGVAVFLGIASAWAQTYSHVRIVRLSFVEGTVTVQRPDAADWAEAPMNTPIQEGFKLSTAENSFAAVEFENGSTVRLGQLSMLEFTQLALASDGSKVNRLNLSGGYATFHADIEGQDIYEVLTPNGTLTPRGKAMFRVDADSSGERVEVFKGSVEFSSSLGAQTLAKDSVLELKPGTDQPEQVAEGITKDDWDRWVQEQESRSEVAANSPSPRAYTSYGADSFYGWSDLSYYGNWSYLPGFGYGWSPYAYAGWSPYSIGRWSWYPGFGYTWISADPWGWLPYHYGGWQLVPGAGWVWFPGSFGYWSPALVTWYVGPGWVGWVPRGGATQPCLRSSSCGTAISLGAFQGGQVVRPGNTLPVVVLSGKATRDLGITPGPRLLLPGKPVAQPAGLANRMVAGGVATVPSGASKVPATLAPSAAASAKPAGAAVAGFATRHLTPGPQAGIAYDAVEGRYVNNPALPSAAGAKGFSSGASATLGSKTQVHGVLVSPSLGPANLISRPAELPLRPLTPTSSGGNNPVLRAVPVPSEAPRRIAPTPGLQNRALSPTSISRSDSGARMAGGAPAGAHAASAGGGMGGGMSGGMAGGAHGGGVSSGAPHR